MERPPRRPALVWPILCAGFALGYIVLRRAALRGEIENLSERALERLVGALIVGVVLGGRLGFVAQNIGAWRADPLFPLKIWGGGMAFFGGLAGVLLAVAWAVWRYKLRFWQVTDALTFPSALGLGFGRLANFVNGELVGAPTSGKWGVVFPKVDALPGHPSQLYEAASHFALWALLLFLARRHRAWAYGRAGRLSLVFLSFYGFARFGTDFFRADDTYFGPLSSGQWASLLVAGVGLFFLARTGGKTRNPKAPSKWEEALCRDRSPSPSASRLFARVLFVAHRGQPVPPSRFPKHSRFGPGAVLFVWLSRSWWDCTLQGVQRPERYFHDPPLGSRAKRHRNKPRHDSKKAT